MVLLGVIACSKENSRNPQKNNTEDIIVRPIIGDVPFEYLYKDVLKWTAVPDDWQQAHILHLSEQDLLEHGGVNFNTNRLLLILDDKENQSTITNSYSCKVVSMVGDENNIVVTIQTTKYDGVLSEPTIALPPGLLVKIPKTGQSIILNQLPLLEKPTSSFGED